MKNEMENFELRFAEALKGAVLPMDEVLCHVGAVAGKRLRPQLVLMTARLFDEVNETTRRTALFVELLHTATLIHDDVVDGSDVRRGQPSVNARWNNQVAVLAGDYLLAKAMQFLSRPEDSLILNEMLHTTMAMSEGELMQNSELSFRQANSALCIPKSEIYLDIITRKTAMLLRSCCVGGALSVGASQDIINKVGDFGLNLGLVFQMRDDILDDDSMEATTFAKELIPEYLDKALKALEALIPFTKNIEALEELRSLAMFSAQRVS